MQHACWLVNVCSGGKNKIDKINKKDKPKFLLTHPCANSVDSLDCIYKHDKSWNLQRNKLMRDLSN